MRIGPLPQRWRAALLAILLSTMAAPDFARAQSPPAKSGGRLNVLGWPDFFDAKSLDDFTRETGIRIVYDPYDAAASAEQKLAAGSPAYDVVVLPAASLPKLQNARNLRPLEKARLDTLRHLSPDFARLVQGSDRATIAALPYSWSSVGLGLNLPKIRERLGDRAFASWDIALKPENAAKLADCGIQIMDSPDDILPALLAFVGGNALAPRAEDLRKGIAALARIRPHIRAIQGSDYLGALTSGSACLTIGVSGDILQAKKHAESSKAASDTVFLLPREGSVMLVDVLAIPTGALRVEEAYRFLDFLMRPEIAARNAASLSQASTNLAARDLMPAALAGNANITPPPDMMKRLHPRSGFEEKLQRTLQQEWNRLKGGK